jgi:hypothetical protein
MNLQGPEIADEVLDAVTDEMLRGWCTQPYTYIHAEWAKPLWDITMALSNASRTGNEDRK